MEEFFEYLILKVDRMVFVAGLGGHAWQPYEAERLKAELSVLKNHAKGTIEHPHVFKKDESWRQVLRMTKDIGFWDEFKGNEKLRNELRKFLAKKW